MPVNFGTVFRGVQPDLRVVIKDLMSEGWAPSKTNGGHIRLDHPQAATPVFAPSTPGDFRAPENLRRDCRCALRMPRRDSPCEDGLSEEEARATLRAHKAASRKSRRPKPQSAPAAPRVVAEPVRTLPSEPDRHDPAPIETPETTPPPEVMAPETPKKETLKMQTQSATPPINMPVAASGSAPKRGQTRAPVTRRTSPTPVNTGLDTRSLSLGIQIGMGIEKGDLKQIPITADMVGGTLVVPAGETFLLGSEAPKAGRKRIFHRKNGRFNDAILGFLGDLKGEEVPVSMIAEHMVEKGFYKPRSARQGVMRRLAQLAEEGKVAYRIDSRDPAASIKG